MSNHKYTDNYLDAAIFRGQTIKKIKQDDDDSIEFETEDGVFEMFHSQDCCESVVIYQIDGDLQSLVGSPLVIAKESSSPDSPYKIEKPEYSEESETWTTYTFETKNAKVRIVWHGSSNSYYSESVQIIKVNSEGVNPEVKFE